MTASDAAIERYWNAVAALRLDPLADIDTAILPPTGDASPTVVEQRKAGKPSKWRRR